MEEPTSPLARLLPEGAATPNADDLLDRFVRYVSSAGLTLYLTHRHDDDATMQLGAVPTRNGGQLVLTGRF